MDRERVEFLEVDPAPPGTDEVSEIVHGDARNRGPTGSPHARRWIAAIGVLVAVVVTMTVVLAVRGSGDAPTPPPVAIDTRPVTGVVSLPPGVKAPRTLVTAPGKDVVWAVDSGSGVVRIAAGHVTSAQTLESQVTALAVSPDGRDLYVAMAGRTPQLLVLDATRLTYGKSVALPSAPLSIAVSADAVWAAMGGTILHFGLHDLTPLSNVPLPGVITTQNLSASFDFGSGAERLTGIVTTGIDGARLLSVETLTGTVSLGAPHLGTVELAHSPLLTWLSWSVPASRTTITAGYTLPPGNEPEIEAGDAVTFGSRLYDAGAGYAAFYAAAALSSVISCRDEGGFETGRVDVATTVPGVVAIGPVLRVQGAFYAVTNKGLVRTGVGDCA